MVSETAAVSDGRSFARADRRPCASAVLCNVPQLCFLRDMAHEQRHARVRLPCCLLDRAQMAQRQRCLALALSLRCNGQRQSALPDRLRTNGQRRAQTGAASMPVKVSGRTRCTLQRRCSSSRQSTCTEAEICNPFSAARTPQHTASAQIT